MKLSNLIKDLQLKLEKEPDLDKLELLVMLNEGYGYSSEYIANEIMLSLCKKVPNGKYFYHYEHVDEKNKLEATHVILDFIGSQENNL